MTLIVNVLSTDNTICQNVVAEQVLIPGLDGILGVLEGHVTLMTCLDVGLISIKTKDTWIPVISITGGVAEIDKNRVTIVADQFEEFKDKDLDIKKAEQEVKNAVENFQNFDENQSFNEALKRLKRANAQLTGIQLLEKSKEEAKSKPNSDLNE